MEHVTEDDNAIAGKHLQAVDGGSSDSLKPADEHRTNGLLGVSKCDAPRLAYQTYFIEFNWLSVVKIGRATNVLNRVKSVLASCPIEPSRVVYLPYDIEGQLHELFLPWHQRLEWFKLNDPMRDLITAAATSPKPDRDTFLKLAAAIAPARRSFQTHGERVNNQARAAKRRTLIV